MNAIVFFMIVISACGLAGCLVRRVIPGRDAHFVNSLIAAAVSAFLCVKYGPDSALVLAGGLASAAAVVVIVCGDWWLHRWRIRKSVRASQAVREFGLAKFDILDDDGDGLVSAVDLYRVSASKRLVGADEKMLERIVDDLTLIGHWTPIGPCTAHVLRHVIDNPSHVITREEFETYPQRVKQLAEQMFGEPAAA